MITWKQISENINKLGLVEGFNWNECKGIFDIEIDKIPKDKLITIVFDYIEDKTNDVDHKNVINNIKKLDEIERNIYCSYQYHLIQIMDGFWAVFTGYYSPLIFEIRKSLEKIKAKFNYELLNEAIIKINQYNKNEGELLVDIENEELNHLFEEETEEKYNIIIEELDNKWNSIYWENIEIIEERIYEYIINEYQLTIA